MEPELCVTVFAFSGASTEQVRCGVVADIIIPLRLKVFV